ncbi:hypothetical protein [Aquimarina mytili]|uniref:Uncharacterized protein n=1 Tax=Aquimarina mytili TaxID=874423 RepID=A0A937A248_9FLAO|nr:hypothetical protein [Aquimarina mytili]MBL0685486.1 hypothetical protein [Aquimarina mytili]
MQNIIQKVLISILFTLLYQYSTAQQMKDSIINDNSFKIKELPQNSYQGVFKNGKPYEGYFKKGDREFYTVDFYEKGIPKYQYSMDILEQMSATEFVLNIKSTYKEGKIYNGSELTLIKDGILSKQFNNGELEHFMLDVFAVHYYNRLTFKKQKDTILISNLQEKDYHVALFVQNERWIAQLRHQDNVLFQQENVSHSATQFPKNSLVRLYIEDTIERGIAYQISDNKNVSTTEARINEEIFNTLDFSKLIDYDTAFNTLAETIIENQGFVTEKNYKNPPTIIAYFETDDKGAIIDGIRCIHNKERSTYQIYKAGKVTKEDSTTIIAFQEIFSNYIRTQ